MRMIFNTALSVVLLTASATAADDVDTLSKAIVFPVVVDAATKTGGEAIKNGEVFYEQALRSTKAIRLKSDLRLNYKTRSRLLGDLGPTTNNAFSVKAGQMFILALRAGGEVYCATVSDQQDDSLGRIYEIAVCLKDVNADGVFEKALALESYPYRARVPYEIATYWGAAWQDISAETEAVAPSGIPAAQITMHFQVEEGTLLHNERDAFTSEICWPKELLSGTAGTTGACGMLDWFTDGYINSNISAKAKAKGTLVKTDISIAYERNEDGTIKTEVTRALLSGVSLLMLKGWMVRDTDFRGSTSVISVLPFSLDLSGKSPSEAQAK